jgi:MarR family transcriptional regulator, organic hydroperoxide resistance regulator
MASASSEDLTLLALQRATHASLQVLAAELVDLDLTAGEMNCLANLADGRGRAISEVGAAVGIKPTTLTGVLDRLEKRGYITRGALAGDRRAILVELTRSGQAAADMIHASMLTLERNALASFSKKDIRTFRAMLDAITNSPE